MTTALRSPRVVKALRAGAVVLVLALLGGWALHRDTGRRAQARGADLFHGRAPLPGRLAGHDAPLPTLATRCSNCHDLPATSAPAGVAGARGTAGNVGTVLDRAALGALRSRRGAPPSRFDAASLCALLRTGIDPAQVMIPATMPRYDVTPTQCNDLWTYLLSR